MDPETGKLYEGTEDDLKAVEDELERKLVRVDRKIVLRDEVTGMTDAERRCYAKKVERRRAKNKARRKAKRRNRK